MGVSAAAATQNGDAYEKVVTIVITPKTDAFLEVAAALNHDCEVGDPTNSDDSKWLLCHHTEASDTNLGDHEIFLSYLQTKIDAIVSNSSITITPTFEEFGVGDGGVDGDGDTACTTGDGDGDTSTQTNEDASGGRSTFVSVMLPVAIFALSVAMISLA